MIMSISSFTAKVIGEKKRWRDYKARVGRLPEPYHGAVAAFERYLMVAGGVVDADSAASLFENLADLFEQGAAEETPIREIVGDDPVEFIEAFIRNYSEGDWRNRERQRLIDAIDRAAGGSAARDGGTAR
jgi:DNA-binding ferritin-like protein (Dps family)